MAHVKIRNPKDRARLRRKRVIRKRLQGTADRPRLSVFRSLKHIYAQAIDDTSATVIAATSDLDKSLSAELEGKKKSERARIVGKAVAAQLLGKNVNGVVFDRNGFIYHGRIKQVAEGAREAGLEF
jgi:large subunit ribosomal protein L18